MNLLPSLRLIWNRIGIQVLACLILGACASVDIEQSYPDKDTHSRIEPNKERDTIFGPGGLDIFDSKKSDTPSSGGGIGVNSFLWRASLDTLSFMPLSSADPFGGVIITDWYNSPDKLDEQFKVTVYIIDRRLRSDALKVAVFKQIKANNQEWQTARIAGGVATQLENAILLRARQLRQNTP